MATKLIKSSFLLLEIVSAIAVANTVITTPADASGCRVPPCGALTNHSNTSIRVKWTDNDKDWKYAYVAPGNTKGGWWNDGLDIDYFYIPSKCSATGGIGGTSKTWYSGWNKISSADTVVINAVNCNLGGI